MFFIFGLVFASLVIFSSRLVSEFFRILLFCTNLTKKYARDDINMMDTILLSEVGSANADYSLPN